MSETTGFVLFILGIFACGPILLLVGRWLERKWKREDAQMRFPTTPTEVIAFIGSNFDSMQQAINGEDVRYSLTVHDLLSAFRELEEFPLAALRADQGGDR